jgi:hypothetical protein
MLGEFRVYKVYAAPKIFKRDGRVCMTLEWFEAGRGPNSEKGVGVRGCKYDLEEVSEEREEVGGVFIPREDGTYAGVHNVSGVTEVWVRAM